MANPGFSVTAITKFAHARLLALAKEHGGIPALARKLGICNATLRSWIYLRKMPACGKIWASCGTLRRGQRETTRKAVLRLCEMAQSTPEDLFPGFVREKLNGKSRITQTTREITFQQLTAVPRQQLTYEVPFDEIDANLDAVDTIGKLWKKAKLSYREREILKLRYGLGDGVTFTLEEVGHIFRVTRERIRNVEAKALRKLRQAAEKTPE